MPPPPTATQRRTGLDGNAVLAACDQYVCVTTAASIHILSTAAPHEQLHPQPALTSCACFNKEGTRLLAGGGKQICLWELPAVSAPTRTWTHSKKIGCVAFSPDGQFALWADHFGEVHSALLTAADAVPTLVLGHLSPVSHLVFSPNGASLITSDREGHVRSSFWPHAFVIEGYCLFHSESTYTHTQTTCTHTHAHAHMHPCTYVHTCIHIRMHTCTFTPTSTLRPLPSRVSCPFPTIAAAPTQLVLSLSCAPLLITASEEGRQVCCWRTHACTMLASTAAADLLAPPDSSPEAGTSAAVIADGAASGSALPPSIIAGCEVVGAGVIALVFAGRASIEFCKVNGAEQWAANSVPLSPMPELSFLLPEAPVAIAHSAGDGGCLVALLQSGAVAVLPSAASALTSGGFKEAAATLLAPQPPAAQPPALPANGDEPDEPAEEVVDAPPSKVLRTE